MILWTIASYVDAMEMVYATADVVVARAGAITCSELLVTATPAILVCELSNMCILN